MTEQRRLQVIELSIRRGDFVTVDDGDWVFWPAGQHGFIHAHELRWLANELDRLNKVEEGLSQ